MKRAIRILVPLVLLVALCAATCPKAEKHSSRIKEEFSEHLNRQFGGGSSDNEEDREMLKVSSFLGSGMMKMFIEDNLTVKNYGVFSIGYIEFRGKSNRVSVGVLGSVFTVPFEKVQKQLFGF